MKRQKHARISQCMIVKNEEKNIEQALSWGKGIVSEQIVVDTGSTDRTVEIAERMGAKVYHFQWIDDFSAAKNFAISKARYEWIAMLDADEYFSEEDAKKLKYCVGVLQNERCDCIMASWVQLDNQKRVMAIHTQIRVFRNDPTIRYANRIHESLTPLDGRRFKMYDATKELSILHTGYGEMESKAKRESGRNLKLILAELADNPENFEMYGYLGNEYESLRQWDKAEEAYRKAVALMPVYRREYDATTSGTYFRLLELLAARPGTDEAELREYYRQAVTGWPKNADYDYVIGNYFAVHGNYQEGEKHLKQALALLDQYGNYYGASQVSARLMSAYELLATCCYNNNNLTDCVKLATAVLKENSYYMSTLMVLLSAFRKDMTKAGKGREGAAEVVAFLGRAFYDLNNLRDRLFLLKGAGAAHYPELMEVIRGLFTKEELACIEQAEKKRSLRIALFYCGVESFNFFADCLEEELKKKGHDAFILDLANPPEDDPHSYQKFSQFVSQGLDAVISFDGIGTREELYVKQWDKQGVMGVNILMDAPFRLHPFMTLHPKKYHMFCCDLEHVEYMKKYFKEEVPSVSFMPHVGSMSRKDAPVIPYRERKYDVLFSATYYRPEDQFAEMERQQCAKDSDEYRFYQLMYENLKKDSHLTIEQAAFVTLKQINLNITDMNGVRQMLNHSIFVDWAIRMYQRERVVSVLAEAGVELYLLGRGWENHPSAQCPNVHRIDDRIPYGQTLEYMANAKINLNVMPWFKEGTHDRIFNTLLQHSVPLTDSSAWIDRNFTDGEDIALYDLDHLEMLPDIVNRLLTDTTYAESIIQKGYDKVSQKFTWAHCADWILEVIQQER